MIRIKENENKIYGKYAIRAKTSSQILKEDCLLAIKVLFEYWFYHKISNW